MRQINDKNLSLTHIIINNMKSNFKKQLKSIQEKLEEVYSELENLNNEFEEWYDDHNENWFDSPTCEKAEEDKDYLDTFLSDMDTLKCDIEDFLNQ